MRAEQPGTWLRVTALGAATALVLTVAAGASGLGTAHRLVAALALPPLVAICGAAWFCHRRLLAWAVASLCLFGAAAFATDRPAHVALAALALAATTAVAVGCFRSGPIAFGDWRDYLTLTKPRIMSLLLVTGFGGLVAGAHGVPPAGITMAGLGGLALACGGASALNHLLDRDLDLLLGERTRTRPVAAGRIAAPHALEFGLFLSACSFTLLASAANVLTAVLALAGNMFYVLVYTRLLKRSTPQNIVIGGAAGAVPPLVGWAAATGDLALPALYLFAIVFLWTPPHFWALALLIKRHYEAARVPMLPVVRGDAETARQIVLYAALLVAFTCVPYAAGAFGLVYLASALVLGSAFVWLALVLRRETTPARAARLFHYSLLYLALLFVAVAVDAAL